MQLYQQLWYTPTIDIVLSMLRSHCQIVTIQKSLQSCHSELNSHSVQH